MNEWCVWALLFLQLRDALGAVEELPARYGTDWEEYETKELVSFVEQATREVHRRSTSAPALAPVRVTRALRIYIGAREVKIRPMAKTVLLLFLHHPEGIPLKCIGDYRKELARYYGLVARSSDKALIERRIQRIEDLLNNELNVHIARVNAALSALVEAPLRSLYRIDGGAGQSKSIPLASSGIIWE